MADELHLDEPLSFWGGLDPVTGRIVDAHHPQRGACIAGRRLVLPGTRGSTSSPGVLVEAIRLGNGPAAIVLPGPDLTVMSAVAIARQLYGIDVPVSIQSDE